MDKPARSGPTRSNSCPCRPAGPRASPAAFVGAISVAAVTDQGLFLAADEDEDRSDNAEHQPTGRTEYIGRRELPDRRPGMALDQPLELLKARFVDLGPVLGEVGDDQRVSGDRLGAVAHERHEPCGQYPQADKAEY